MPNPQNPVFPNNVAQDIDLTVVSNRALSQLTVPIDGVTTQFTVVDGSKFNTPTLVQIDTEIILVGAKSGNVLQSCTRGFNLTSAATHAQNADVKGYALAYHHNQMAAEVKAIEAALGANLGNVVTQTDMAGGSLTGVFSNLHLLTNGVTEGTYGGFNRNIVMTVDSTGRVTSIANALGNINYPIMYKGALVQGTNAVLGFSFGNTNAPNAVPYTESGGSIYAVASFTQDNNYGVQDHFYIPDDWKGDTVSLDIYWRSSATSGSVIWAIEMGSLRSGVGPDISFNGAATANDPVSSTSMNTVKTRITPLNMSGIQPGDEVFFKFYRDGVDDTLNATAELVSIKFNLNRDFSLVQ